MTILSIAFASDDVSHRGLDAHIHVDSVVFWGFAATVALTTIIGISQGLRLTRMSLPLMLGTMVTGRWDRAKVYGFAIHFLNGWIFSLPYALAFETWDLATWWLGSAIGVVHAVFILAAVLPILPGIHPRMASEYQQPEPTPLLEPPGFMALNYGVGTPLVTLVAHVVYGAVLGSFYQLTRA